jgi:gluconokinase
LRGKSKVEEGAGPNLPTSNLQISDKRSKHECWRYGHTLVIVVIMGVTGSGKTTIGVSLAARLGWEFVDADSFHSAANVEKISRGIALDDADRAPWLMSLRKAMEGWVAEQKSVVLACSALKQSYRDELCISGETRFVFQKGSYDLIARRLRQRHGHFASETILASQFAALEEPDNAITVDISRAEDEIVAEVVQRLGVNRSDSGP